MRGSCARVSVEARPWLWEREEALRSLSIPAWVVWPWGWCEMGMAAFPWGPCLKGPKQRHVCGWLNWGKFHFRAESADLDLKSLEFDIQFCP